MRSAAWLAPLVLAIACACSAADGDAREEPASGSTGPGRPAYEPIWTSSLDVGTVLGATACGDVTVSTTFDGSSQVVLEDMETGRTSRPEGLVFPRRQEDGLPPDIQFTCVASRLGPRIVVDQTLVDTDRERFVRRLTGLKSSGDVAWTRRLGATDVFAAENGVVTLSVDGEGLYDHATVIDASDGSSIVHDVRLDQVEAIAANRLAYFESDTGDPVITDAMRRPVTRVSVSDRVEVRLTGWVGGDGVAVLMADQHEMTGFDAETGAERWTLPTGALGGGDATVDADSGVLITTDTITGDDAPAPTGDGANTYSGIDLDSGEVLWRWSSDLAPSDLTAAGGAFAVGRLGPGGYGAAFDSRTGTQIELGDDAKPVAVSSEGILVAVGAELQLRSR